MRLADHQFETLVLVCVNEREDGKECCAQKGSPALYEQLKQEIRNTQTNVPASQQKIRVSKTGCLGNCSSGITVAVFPESIYFGEVTEADIPTIVDLVMKRYQ